MRLPKQAIYWHCIASKYLDLSDLARVEASIDNHSARKELGLKRYSHETLVFQDDEVDPYINYLCVVDSPISVNSDDSYYWCTRRRIRIPYMKLEYGNPPKPDTFPFDLFMYVKKIHISVRLYDGEKVFSRLQSLTALMYDDLATHEIEPLINQVQQNSVRPFNISPGPHELEYLRMNVKYVSQSAFQRLLDGIPSITTLLLLDEDELNDSSMKCIANAWKKLSYLYLSGSCVSDNSLTQFLKTKQSFNTVKIFDNPALSGIGLMNILNNSSYSLIELGLFDIFSLVETELIDILAYLPNLRTLSVFRHDNRYSNSLMLAIGQYCTMLRSIYIFPTRQYGYTSYEAICSSCRFLESIKLGYVGVESVDHLSKSFGSSLRSLSLYVNEPFDVKQMFPNIKKSQSSVICVETIEHL